MYEQIMVGSALDQGDIIDDCPILLLNAPTIGIDDDFKAEANRAGIVVLTQA